MLAAQRKDLILATLRSEGRVVAKELAAELDLSEDTIRRDLRELAAEGRLHRVHGGALPASPAVADFTVRTGIGQEAKVEVGRLAAGLVRPGQTVAVDGGTTALQLARHLPRDLVATVVTHSPTIAVELATHPSVEVIIVGGRLFKHSVVAAGAAAHEAIGRISADVFFLGVTGIHPVEGLTTGDADEAAIKRAWSQRSAETYVLGSGEKIGAASAVRGAPPGRRDRRTHRLRRARTGRRRAAVGGGRGRAGRSPLSAHLSGCAGISARAARAGSLHCPRGRPTDGSAHVDSPPHAVRRKARPVGTQQPSCHGETVAAESRGGGDRFACL